MNKERNLWASVLERAIIDLGKKNKLNKQSALFWLENKKEAGICSFVWICKVLDVNPKKTRKIILNKYHIKKERYERQKA